MVEDIVMNLNYDVTLFGDLNNIKKFLTLFKNKYLKKFKYNVEEYEKKRSPYNIRLISGKKFKNKFRYSDKDLVMEERTDFNGDLFLFFENNEDNSIEKLKLIINNNSLHGCTKALIIKM